MNVFYENVKYTMLMEKCIYMHRVSVLYLFIYLTVRNVRDITNSETDLVFEHNTNGLFLNTFEFKVLE